MKYRKTLVFLSRELRSAPVRECEDHRWEAVIDGVDWEVTVEESTRWFARVWYGGLAMHAQRIGTSFEECERLLFNKIYDYSPWSRRELVHMLLRELDEPAPFDWDEELKHAWGEAGDRYEKWLVELEEEGDLRE